MMGNYPEFIKQAWLWTIRRQYIFGLRHWNHALINHWIVTFVGYGDISRQNKSILQVCFPGYMNMRGLITRPDF